MRGIWITFMERGGSGLLDQFPIYPFFILICSSKLRELLKLVAKLCRTDEA